MGIHQDKGSILSHSEWESVVGLIEQSEIRRHATSKATTESRGFPLSAGFVVVVNEGLYPPYF